MFFGALFTIPDASTTFNGLGQYSAPVVTEFLPVIYLIGGIALGIGVVAFIIYTVSDAMSHKKKQ